LAIAIHNIPEDIVIALPVYMATGRRDVALGVSLKKTYG
jgi:ZIP family zinc transporter